MTSSLREANLARVLRAVLAAGTPPTRAEVAAATAIGRPTVSRLVDDLLAGGLLTELDRQASVGPGRPGTPLAGGDRIVALGLQVNVGYLAALLVDLRGEVLAERVVTSDQRGSSPAEVLRRMGEVAVGVAAAAAPGSVLVGCRVAVPGLVAPGSGTLLRAPNLGWYDVAVPALLDLSGLGCGPVRVGNEADLASATVSMAAPGRPSALTDFVYLSGEIGIGGAIVLDGRPVPGRHGWAGEIGHVTVDPAGPACACGSQGCLEQYAGRRAVLAAAGMPPEARLDTLVARVRTGDPAAVDAVERAAWGLGCALAGVVNVVDVPDVVLDGHLRELAALLQPSMEDTLRARVLSAAWDPPRVVAAVEHPAPGALGAAYLELERVVATPAAWLSAPAPAPAPAPA